MRRDEREFRLCCAIADFLRFVMPDEIVWTHFPAGEKRTKITGARLKRMGLRRSIPDYQVFWQPMILMEAKAPGGRLTDGQKETFPLLEASGYPVHMVYSTTDVEQVLLDHGVPLKGRTYPVARAANLFAGAS